MLPVANRPSLLAKCEKENLAGVGATRLFGTTRLFPLNEELRS